MCLTKKRTVGFTSSFDCPLSVYTAKGLNTLASACEEVPTPFQGVRIGVKKYEALVASIRNREGFEDVLSLMGLLNDVIGLAKMAIRKHRGMVVTAAMQDDLLRLIVGHARTSAGWVRVMGYKNKTQPMLSMFTEECRLHARTDADMVQQSTSLSTVSSTGVASSRSRPSAMTSTVPRSSSESTSSSGTAEEGVMEYFSSAEVVEPVLPGSEIVVAEQPLGTVERTVELLEVYLPGSATICRWLSRAVAVTFSRVRAWM